MPALSKPQAVAPGFMMSRFEPDDELLNFTASTVPQCVHVEAESLVGYSQLDDAKRGKPVEVISVNPGKKVTVPKSMNKSPTVIVWAGTWPKFDNLDKFGNLTAIVPEGCAMKVEFVGQSRGKPQVKIYKAI